jgi:hypothetical protein
MPRQPKWVDVDGFGLEVRTDGDSVHIVLDDGGLPLIFAATPEDARDIADALIAWADKLEGK